MLGGVREEREVRLSSPPGGTIQLLSCSVFGDGKASNLEMTIVTHKKSPNKNGLSKGQGEGLPSEAGNF